MDWITPILSVLAKQKSKKMTSREIIIRVLELPEMAYEKEQYKGLEWTDQQIADQLYKDSQNQTNLVLTRLCKDGYIESSSLDKDKPFKDLKKCHMITKKGLKRLKKEK